VLTELEKVKITTTNKMSLTLKQASAICDRALEVGHLNKLNPLTVAVFDVGGNLVCFKKEDGSSLLRQEIASGKALAGKMLLKLPKTYLRLFPY